LDVLSALKTASFQRGFNPGEQEEIQRREVGTVGRLWQRYPVSCETPIPKDFALSICDVSCQASPEDLSVETKDPPPSPRPSEKKSTSTSTCRLSSSDALSSTHAVARLPTKPSKVLRDFDHLFQKIGTVLGIWQPSLRAVKITLQQRSTKSSATKFQKARKKRNQPRKKRSHLIHHHGSNIMEFEWFAHSEDL